MPDLCTISGTIYKADGTAAANVSLYSVELQATGVAVKAEFKRLATSDEDGAVSFDLIRGSVVRLHGPVYVGGTDISPSEGVEFAVPDASTATLESLGSAASVPTQGLTWKIAGVLQSNLATVLDFGSGLTVTESPTGEVNVSSSAVVDAETVQDLLSTFFHNSGPVTWVYNDAQNRVEIAIAAATTGAAGLMSAADKTAVGALGTASTRNVPASGNASSSEVVKGDDTRLSDSRTPTGGAGGVLSGTYPNPGFAVDMATQAELESEASARIAADLTLQTNVDGKQPLDSDLTAVAALSPSDDDILQRKAGAWTNRTPAQLKTDLALVKADVGLSNVDNTADSAKPVSTAQQTALDAKANAAFSGYSEKTTPVDADTAIINDSAASGAVKRLTWANLKATLKTYFDTLYQAASAALTEWAAKARPSGVVVGTTDAQTLTNKTIALGSNSVSGTLAQFSTAVTDADLARTDAAQTLTGNQTVNGSVLASSEGTHSIGSSASGRFNVYAYGLSVGNTSMSSGEAKLGSGTGAFRYQNGFIQLGSATSLGWSSGDPNSVAEDVRVKRVKASVVEVNNAGAGGGTFRFVPTSPAQITADQNNYALGGGAPSYFVRLTSDASRTLTGLSVSQVDGEIHQITNVGSNNIVLAHESASSTAANRFTNSTGADVTLGANETALVWYDGTSSRWRVFKVISAAASSSSVLVAAPTGAIAPEGLAGATFGAAAHVIAPHAFTVNKMKVETGGTQGDDALFVRLVKNGTTVSTLTIPAASPAGIYSASPAAAFAEGDILALSCENAATDASATINSATLSIS